MGHNLSIKAQVTGVDSDFFYCETHEWKGLNDQAFNWLTNNLNAIADKHKKPHGKDSGKYKAELTGSADGADFSRPAQLINYEEMVKFEKDFNHLSDELLKIAEKRVKDGKR